MGLYAVEMQAQPAAQLAYGAYAVEMQAPSAAKQVYGVEGDALHALRLCISLPMS